MNHRFVAETMCSLTHSMLWLPRQKWAEVRRPGVDLSVAVGRGKATYVSSSKNNTGPLKLIYGIKMIESKTDPSMLQRWLTGREILERGYFGGELNLLNALTQTMVHEFSHVVQVLMGARYDGEVHNDEFYRIVQKAHDKGHAENLRDELHRLCIGTGIDLTSIESNAKEEGLTMNDFTIGMPVFMRGAESKHNPLRVVRKRRTRVEAISNTGQKLVIPVSMLFKTPSS